MHGIAELGCVALGGAAGAACRYLASSVGARRSGVPAWVAIMVVNVTGCLLAGLVTGFLGGVKDSLLGPLLITGFLGGFTTFSTAMLDAWVLWKSGRPIPAGICLIATPVVGVLAAFFGLLLWQSIA